MEQPLISAHGSNAGVQTPPALPHSDGPPSTPDSLEVKFRYKSLPRDRQIQVLDLAPGAWDDTIDCTLRTVDLDDKNLHYEAVSYVWGDATDQETILCGGLRVSITGNLFEALQRFRAPDATRTLWADAICINQGDNDEKTLQIRLMSAIYRRASQILVWLQHGEDDVVQAALNAICRFRCTMEPWLNRNKRVSYRLHGREVNTFGNVDPSEIAGNFMAALSPVAKMAWFSRGWVIQEVLLGSTVPLVYIEDMLFSISSGFGPFSARQFCNGIHSSHASLFT
ncbi:HET-domain-containing protein [Pyrenophora teres f. maculata]|nr:HET-domain-containing protein [Pyrenophora teres f. maculata]